ncbi:TetR/AcrR family transcriptional regulator [Clostridium felsineum]|uniref:TetR/AcrR family transcriptional regulator n=1 Tax=Clostridium felsineum TaxID=36839 RepID=UPI00098CBBE4|nr:TetR/AcrR family transcriptional regulator [Clostridium felsineum]URZ17111.1 hypothetical protein CLFE_031630 [Clostridium felsineum DSM 794]
MKSNSKSRMSHEERKKQIISVGKELMLKKGFGFTAKDIANVIGISETMVYCIFPNKKKIIEAIYSKIFSSIEISGLPKEAGENYRSELIDYFMYFYKNVMEKSILEFHFLYAMDKTGNRPDVSLFTKLDSNLNGPLENYIISGINKGYFRKVDAGSSAEFIYGAFFNFIFFHELFLREKLSQDEIKSKITAFIDYFINGISKL